jgi:hypothetical protein
MLAPDQQPLPKKLERALAQALASGAEEDFARALELARPGGYA